MRRRHWITLGAIVVAFGAIGLIRRSLGLDFDPQSLQTLVVGMGVWAPLAFVAIVTFRVPLGLPSAVVLVGGGALFGALPGTLYGAAGILISGIFLFFAARYSGRESIMARLPRMRTFFELAGSRVGALVLILGSGYPMGPVTLCHLVSGVAGMGFLTFLVAGATGALMRAGVYTFFGSRLMEGDLWGLIAPTLLMTATLVVPMLFPRSRAWLLESMGRRPRVEEGA
jgi:uncharacterized membrane protein YdjX (TVP38/TMEM64 family)